MLLSLFASKGFLQNKGRTMDLEKRFIAIPSTKLTLKHFLTKKLFISLKLQNFLPFLAVVCGLSLATFLVDLQGIGILKALFRLRLPNPRAMAIGSANLRFGPGKVSCCAMKSA
jgi:hypothetical protein